jgi:transcription-repair coupling factor (superfamily II helicase)
LTPIARERLLSLQEHTALGSGFQIAMRDLEIRGMGNILGREQHGHIAAIGFDLYSSLLSKAVLRMRGEKAGEEFSVTLDSYRSGELPEKYIPSPRQRMSIHKRMAALTSSSAREHLRAEIEDLYGKPPPETEMLFKNLEIKELAGKARIDHLHLRPELAKLRFNEQASQAFSPELVIKLDQAYPKKIRVSVQKRIYLEIKAPAKEELWENFLKEILHMLVNNSQR